uniref:Uncharacterized protein n=1 Tax=Magallana gigas TaxID=29159 RepID=K1P0Q4_MAGGI
MSARLRLSKSAVNLQVELCGNAVTRCGSSVRTLGRSQDAMTSPLEKLIRLLSPEKFAVVGVQLFYCKNFEYNLQKLKDGRGHSTA